MGDAARNQRKTSTERPDAELGRFGVFAILALLVFAAAPGLRLLTGVGPAAGWTAERGALAPAEAGGAEAGAAEADGDESLRHGPRRIAAATGPAPGAPAAGLAVSIALPPMARTPIRSDGAAASLPASGRPRPYDPRAPPAA